MSQIASNDSQRGLAFFLEELALEPAVLVRVGVCSASLVKLSLDLSEVLAMTSPAMAMHRARQEFILRPVEVLL